MAQTNENSLKNLKMFSSTYQPKKNGRKPSKLKRYLKDNNLSSKDAELIASNLLYKSRKELQEMAANKDIPIMLSGAASAMLKDIIKGQTNTIQWLQDRAYGKAKQYVDQTNRDAAPDVTNMTPLERKEMLKKLVEARGGEIDENNS